MAFRCLLVGLVASLGFELPSGQDVTCWRLSSQGWVAARTVDLSALGAEASGWLGLTDPTMNRSVHEGSALPAVEALVALPADLAFDSISEGMALAFADDSSGTMIPERSVELAFRGIADVTQKSEVDCRPDMEPLALAFPAPAAVATDEEGDESSATLPPSADCLSSAVQLTRDAAHAWTLFVHSLSGEPSLTR